MKIKYLLPSTIVVVLTLLVAFNFGTTSCVNSRGAYKPRALGAPGEVLLVIDSPYWKAQAGQVLKNLLEADFPALPQIEPLFKRIRITHEQFQKQYKTHRNILRVSFNPKGHENRVDYKRNTWAHNQWVIDVVAKDMNGFVKIVNGHGLQICDYFYEGDMTTLVKAYERSYEVLPTKVLSDVCPFELKFPKGFRVRKNSAEFSWFSFERIDSDLGVFTHQCSLDSIEGIEARDLIAYRNNVLKLQVPGTHPGSFMTTEERFPVTVTEKSFGGKNWVELRGLWKVQGDFMGGPFVSYFHRDEKKNQLIMLEGYVHAPQKPNKANFVREVEAVLRTFKSQYD